MATEVVKFDVGGQVYKVSRSLLNMHPDSMLARSASDRWQDDPEAEIFVEGDSARFRYVLDYLRHGSVTLPITESKESLMKDLEYYGIDVSKNTIDDSAMHKAKSFHSFGIAEDYSQKPVTDQSCQTVEVSSKINTDAIYQELLGVIVACMCAVAMIARVLIDACNHVASVVKDYIHEEGFCAFSGVLLLLWVITHTEHPNK